MDTVALIVTGIGCWSVWWALSAYSRRQVQTTLSIVRVTLTKSGVHQEVVATLPETAAADYIEREREAHSFLTDWYTLPVGQPLPKLPKQ